MFHTGNAARLMRGRQRRQRQSQNEYKNALSDSITIAERQIDSCENKIKILTDNVNQWLRDFTVVDNKREVESYYIFNGWQESLPLFRTLQDSWLEFQTVSVLN